jgi:hypothetical protein
LAHANNSNTADTSENAKRTKLPLLINDPFPSVSQVNIDVAASRS